ncbi:MAG: hypothetical protein IIT65_15610 [Lachnospiraceae bacterium]|nr:hypothetical protein [Lachnospiraceae bacterium]
MQCIFCHKDSSTSKSVEHIIPESLGNMEHILPKGYVCDTCNNYFSVKIEKELLAQPYFVSMRRRNDIRTKHGRFVKETFIFPSIMDISPVSYNPEEKIVYIENDSVVNAIISGKCNKAFSLLYDEPDTPNTFLSRFLAKCAYEYFLYNMGKENYDLCVQEYLGRGKDILKELREYARYGLGKYWQYNQRRIYSEGDYYYNQNENICYEILHEMKLFVKEHKHFQNGNVEAEIYFVMAIAGIEYAICLSDPDISGYKKWIAENNDLSPLKDDAERLSFSMADVNPMLIKKNDDRIH